MRAASGPASGPALALTFDDGPDATGTPMVLAELEAAAARATFFVVAPLAREHPELVAAIRAGGHAIGLHCHEHVRHSDRGMGWCERDTRRALGTLAELGVHPTVWRTPWGDVAPWTAAVARRHRLRVVGWTVDCHDWRGDTADEMLAATQPGLRAGAIVLAHDGIGPGARRADAAQTAAYVRLVAAHARTHGLEPVTLR